MPMRRDAYPPDWAAISLAVREAAGWKCVQCGAPNGQWISRNARNPIQWRPVDFDAWQSGDERYDWGSDWKTPTRVGLTVHHAGVPYPDGRPGDRHDKMDNRPENLQALCQRCHLLADLDIHVANAKRTRLARKVEAGQMELWKGES